MKTEYYNYKIPDENILHAPLLDSHPLQLLLLTESGNIYLWDLASEKYRFLCSLPEGMDLKKDITVYCFHNYVCIVQSKDIRGVVINLENPDYYKPLQRGDYQVNNCSYPIGFYKKEGLHYLIHGTDWNRLDITCLETDELLTKRLVAYEGEGRENYLDYFHSLLSVSPDGSYFLSNGWVWSPFDVITIFNTENFLKTYEKSAVYIKAGDTSGYNWDRPLCWIDNKHFAVVYSIATNEEEDVDINSPIHLFIVEADTNKVVEQFPFENFFKNNYGDVLGSLYCDTENSMPIIRNSSIIWIGFCNTNGLFITDRYGQLVYSDFNLKSHRYSPLHRAVYKDSPEKGSIEINYLLNE